jgi:hypothetical protein
MYAEDLQAELRRRPFRSFRIFMSDGTTYEVPHPDLVWVTSGSAMIGFPSGSVGGAPAAPERYDVVSLGLIVRLELSEAPAPPGQGDGQKDQP